MHNLRHFYYQNKDKIWKVLLIVALVLGVIYYLDNIVMREQNNQNTSKLPSDSQVYADDQNKTYISGESAITGSTLTETEVNKINNTISKFLRYCRDANSEEAYNMLSEDCKQERYTSLEKFAEEYIKKKFNKEQVYKIENWTNNTYKVTISEDILATGNINTGNTGTEYITIITQNNEEKLNINGYIGKQNISKQEMKNNVRINVIEKNIHMDYEEYTFEIENLSNKVVKLDSFEKTGTIYSKDRAGNKYNAQMHEILEDEAIINPNQSVKLKIKFTNSYFESGNIGSITFENLILDYNKYKKTEDKENFNDKCKITINL